MVFFLFSKKEAHGLVIQPGSTHPVRIVPKPLVTKTNATDKFTIFERERVRRTTHLWTNWAYFNHDLHSKGVEIVHKIRGTGKYSAY